LAYGWGWSEKKFWQSSPGYFFKTWKGKRDERERGEREEWERLRILGAWVLAPYSKNMTPKKLLPLPWDKVETTEDWRRRNKDILDECDKLINGSE